MSQQWHPHSTVACICEHDKKFLMVKESINGKLVYNQPAGHIEENESIIEATVRETLEETAYLVTPKSLTGVYQYRINSDLTFIRFALHCQQPIEMQSDLDPDIDSVHWMSYEQIVARKQQLRSPLVLQCIDDYRKGARHPLSVLRPSV